MNKEADLKLTDLDYLIGDHHYQMMKAALPYMRVPEQKAMSLYIKFGELRRTLQLFDDEEVAAMGISAPQKAPNTPLNMLDAIKSYGNPQEQRLIDMITGFLKNTGRPPLEQLQAFLTPEQQSRFDTMQMMMQAMQIMNQQPQPK